MDSQTILLSAAVAGALAFGGFSLFGGSSGLSEMAEVALGLGATSVLGPLATLKINRETGKTQGLIFDPRGAVPQFFVAGAIGGTAIYYGTQMIAPGLSFPATAAVAAAGGAMIPYAVIYYIFRQH